MTPNLDDSRGRRAALAALIARDGRACAYCGRAVRVIPRGHRAPLRPDHATIDHRIPRAHGGSDEMHNLMIACHTCNNGKGDSLEYRPRKERRKPA